MLLEQIKFSLLLLFFHSYQEKQGSSTPMKDTKRRSQLLLTVEKVKFCYVWVMFDNTFKVYIICNKILNHDWFAVFLFVSFM